MLDTKTHARFDAACQSHQTTRVIKLASFKRLYTGMSSRGAGTVSQTPPRMIMEELKKSCQAAPAGKYTSLLVAPCLVTGATSNSEPNRYSSSMPKAWLSCGNSHQSGRAVGTPRAVTLAANSAM